MAAHDPYSRETIQKIFGNSSLCGVISIFMLSRGVASSLLDSTPFTQKPSRIILWYFIGAAVYQYYAIQNMLQYNSSPRQYILKKRIAENEHTHGLLRTLSFHLSHRKMGIFDAVL